MAKTFFCPICKLSSPSLSDLGKHRRTVHAKNKAITCLSCQLSLRDSYDVKKHDDTPTHVTKKSKCLWRNGFVYRCYACCANFRTCKQVEQHMKLATHISNMQDRTNRKFSTVCAFEACSSDLFDNPQVEYICCGEKVCSLCFFVRHHEAWSCPFCGKDPYIEAFEIAFGRPCRCAYHDGPTANFRSTSTQTETISQ